MDFGLGGKLAMVAAASKGLGLAIAQELAKEGCNMSICARNQEALESAAESLRSLGVKVHAASCDVTSEDSLHAWFESTVSDLGTPAILVTNTGGPPAGRASEMTDAQWQFGVDCTLLNVVRLVRMVSPGMIEAKWGRIVHLTSYVAKDPSAILPISSTLRAGLTALTKLQALELAPHGITVNGILPGNVLTDRQLHLAEVRAKAEGISPQQALERAEASMPMGRLGRPDEIAAAAAFLCSERASLVSGVSLLVDGALSHGLG